MTQRTAAALEKLEELLPAIRSLPESPERARLVEEADHLRRAVAAFHMEAIRFRMYSVDRLIAQLGDEARARTALEELRVELEAAGFHTRSHKAPGT